MSKSNDTVYIYVLQRISDKAYLYIGSAKNPKLRFKRHKLHNPYSIIRAAFASNDIRFITITQTDEAHRIEEENKLWNQFRNANHPIVNSEPMRRPISYTRRVVSAETRRKISQTMKGKPPSNAGMPVSEETRRKMSIAKKGKRHTEEAKHNMSIARMGKPGKPASEETRRKMSEAAKGKPHPHKGVPCSEEAKRKISIANKGKPHSGRPASEETKRKMSEAQKKRFRK